MISDKQKKALARSLSGVNTASDDDVTKSKSSKAALPDKVPTMFVLQIRVLDGTYVCSIVHDLVHTLGSAGHVTPTCSRQKDYVLEAEGDCRCMPSEVFEAALEDTSKRDADVTERGQRVRGVEMQRMGGRWYSITSHACTNK